MHMFSLHDVVSIELEPIKQISSEPFYYRHINVRCRDGSLTQIGFYTESPKEVPFPPSALEVKEVK